MKRVIIIGICMTLLIPAFGVADSLNSPPSKPTIEGPLTGKSGNEYEFIFCSEDPDGDDIYYCIDWGDGAGEICIGPFPSNACIPEKHKWTSDGTYVISAKAQDTFQAESAYTSFTVSMPKIRTQQFFFQIFIEKIFNQFPILRILMNL